MFQVHITSSNHKTSVLNHKTVIIDHKIPAAAAPKVRASVGFHKIIMHLDQGLSNAYATISTQSVQCKNS